GRRGARRGARRRGGRRLGEGEHLGQPGRLDAVEARRVGRRGGQGGAVRQVAPGRARDRVAAGRDRAPVRPGSVAARRSSPPASSTTTSPSESRPAPKSAALVSANGRMPPP